MKPTLLILAAGMASRYGSMKQTEGFGPYGETIMDYSIYDAIKAGFGKVVFIIRKDFAENFKQRFGSILEGKIDVEYVYQELDSFIEGEVPTERTKPWGTGHAILCASEFINEPFAVINADDYYGTNAFQKAADFLVGQCNENKYAIIGYQLDKTLSDHGTVSRGVCEVDEKNILLSISERTKIYKSAGKVFYEDGDQVNEVSPESRVSMNFWCFHQSVFSLTASLFKQFVAQHSQNIKSEFFIPLIADAFIQEHPNMIEVIPTSSKWFGVTYKEDAEGVKQSIDQLINGGVYPSKLWDR